MRTRGVCVLACVLVCLLGMSAALWAQGDVAAVTGRVLDPNGAIIIEATVTAKNVDTGIATVVQTNEDGIYRFASLSPGNYEFTVSKHGFKEILKPGVTLHLADTISMNFNMVVGALTEKVTVVAGAPMINTTDASVSTVVDQSYVANMPLNGRSFQDLILLTPGVITNTPQTLIEQGGATVGASGEFSVNGQRTESNYYTVDGVSGNIGAIAGMLGADGPSASGSIAGSTALGTTQALVSVEDLQEFRVSSSTYSAEYGRNPGAQIAFETKSGTNSWHGSAFDYLRNGYFDAQDWFNDYFATPEPSVHQNDFGGTLGGPLKIPGVYSGKDRTFFFVSYEGLRLMAPQAAIVNVVPDAALRASSAAAVQPVLNGFPLPTPGGIDFGDGTAQYIASWSNPSSLDSTSARLDHVVNDKLKLFFRFSDTGSSATLRQSGGLAPAINLITPSTVRTYTAGATSTFSSRLSNEFRLNYSSTETSQNFVNSPIGGSAPVDMFPTAGVSPETGNAFFGLCYHGVQCQSLELQKFFGAQRQWNFVDTVSYSVGRHQLKFGGDFRRLAPQGVLPINNVFYLFFSESDVQNNSNAFISLSTTNPGSPLYRNFSAFGQDEWRVSPRLSISMGLRWEVNPPPGVTQGVMPYTLQGPDLNHLTIQPPGTPLWKTTWYNFAPRLGAAYTLRSSPDRETVFRGGGGVFFDTGNQLGGAAFAGPGFSAFDFASGGYGDSQTCAFISGNCASTPGGIPLPITQYPFSLPYSGLQLYGYAQHLQLPYTLQWNASIEQALGKSQALTVSYVGSHASRLLQLNQYNVSSDPNTSATSFRLVQNGLTSDYGALQAQFRRRLAQGLTALGSYTWSHCLDWGSFNILAGYQRGNCDFDVRHNFSGAFSYDVPNVGHGRFVSALLGHWGVDQRFTARTAFPLTVHGNGQQQTNGQRFDAGVSLTGAPVYIYGANCAQIMQAAGELQTGQGCPGGVALNPNAFMDVTCPTSAPCLGDATRNFARLFGAWQLDTAIRREFPIYENLKLQFRAEAFNIFNHPNFGAVDGSCAPNTLPATGCTNPTFGLANSTLASSLGVLSPLYQMGGPRSMQFALKLVF